MADQPESLSSSFERFGKILGQQIDSNIREFSNPQMGSRLFVYGACLLAFDVLARIAQWIMVIFRPAANAPVDDVFFIGLLVVSVSAMTAGLIANLYLIWSIQRNTSENARIAQEAILRSAELDELRSTKAAKKDG